MPSRIPSALSGMAGTAALAIASVTFSAQSAVAETVRYCVANASNTHGLYTNDVYYSPQCENPDDRKCISREHYFSFGDKPGTSPDAACSSTLTVDYAAGTAVLHGWVGGNKNDMEVDVDIKFSGLHLCATGDSYKWPKKWGVLPQYDTKNPPLDGSLNQNLYCATTISDAEPDGKPAGDVDGGFGGFGQNMDQQVDPTGGILQLGLGGNALIRNAVGGYANFKVNVPGSDGVLSPKTWELGLTLSDPVTVVEPPPPPPKKFNIVLCPNSGDDGDGIDEVSGRKDCTVCWYGEKIVDPVSGEASCSDETFVTTFRNEPFMRGQITLDGAWDVPDPRNHCGAVGAEPVGEHTVYPGVKVKLDTVTAPAEPGLTISGSALTGDVYIPWYMCGIPRESDGKPFIRLINADSDFLNAIVTDADGVEHDKFRDVINSVVVHDADGNTDSQNSGFICDPAAPNNLVAADKDPRDPVVAWLPRTDEIPMVDGSRQIRDVTAGCGSTRGGSSTRSYLLSNLVYKEGLGTADFRAIIGAEIDLLEATLVAAGQARTPDGALSTCIDVDQNIQSQLFPDPQEEKGQSRYIDHIRNNFDAGEYGNVIQKLEGLLDWLGGGAYEQTHGTLNPDAELFSAFDTCYWKDGVIYNLVDKPALEGEYPDAGSGYQPRNFRGDLQAQTEHILWNIRQHLQNSP